MWQTQHLRRRSPLSVKKQNLSKKRADLSQTSRLAIMRRNLRSTHLTYRNTIHKFSLIQKRSYHSHSNKRSFRRCRVTPSRPLAQLWTKIPETNRSLKSKNQMRSLSKSLKYFKSQVSRPNRRNNTWSTTSVLKDRWISWRAIVTLDV